MKSQIMTTVTLSSTIPEVQQLMDEAEMHSAQAQDLFERAATQESVGNSANHLLLHTLIQQNAYLACVAKADLIMQGLVTEAMLSMVAENRKQLA